MRKVFVKVILNLVIDADESVIVGDVIDEMDYTITSNTVGAEISDTTIEDFEVTDSK